MQDNKNVENNILDNSKYDNYISNNNKEEENHITDNKEKENNISENKEEENNISDNKEEEKHISDNTEDENNILENKEKEKHISDNKEDENNILNNQKDEISNKEIENNESKNLEKENLKNNNKENLNEKTKSENEKENNTYKIIKSIYKTKYGELFLVKKDMNKNDEFLMNKIIINSNQEKSKILEEIETLKLIDSKYIIKIIDYYIQKEEENENIYIIYEDFFIQQNLENLIYETKSLNSRFIWKIFVQLVLGLKSFPSNTKIFKYLIPQRIYLNKENNIKIGGSGIILDFNNIENIKDIDTLSYESPEMIKGEESENSNVFSLGCILYELFFKKKPFSDEFKLHYDLPNKCEDDLQKILNKLLLIDKEKRITIKQLLYEQIFKNKIFEVNLFSEIVQDDMKSKYLLFLIIFRL